MAQEFIEASGRVVGTDDLVLDQSIETIRAIGAPRSYATLIECRSNADSELLILDLEVERPQRPRKDIRQTERIATIYSRSGESWPEALALRVDFPFVAHLLSKAETLPRSLCLYHRTWFEERPHWTAAGFIERIRWWLSNTARDELHQEGQPLEPLMFSHGLELILSSSFGRSVESKWESVRLLFAEGKEGRVLIADDESAPNRGGRECLALYVESQPSQHGIIQRTPNNLAELAALVKSGEFDLIDEIRAIILALPDELREKRQTLYPLLVVGLPKRRVEDGPIEATELKGFLCNETLEVVGDRVGAWEVHGGAIGYLIGAGPIAHDGSSISVAVANVARKLTWERAALISGSPDRKHMPVVAIGAGALGSQVSLNLARSGFGSWTIVDHDELMPHNVVRHGLPGGPPIGLKKASTVALFMNSLADDEPIARGLPVDFLAPGDALDQVEDAISNAELILDMSASLPVARKLASMNQSSRAFSLFLSPDGRDLVLLAEDVDRRCRLDDLEMGYYASVATLPELQGHLKPPLGSSWFGAGCRDVTVKMSQTSVGTFAGIGAAAIAQRTLKSHAAGIIWRQDPTSLAVTAHELPIGLSQKQRHGDWELVVRDSLIQDVQRLRRERLPNETGGILIGGIDYYRRVVHLEMALPSPADSTEWPTVYIRGIKDLRHAVDRVVRETANNLNYVGEWHSHPPNCPTLPSNDDRQVFTWIADLASIDGRPPVMLIAGDDGVRLFVERVDDPYPEPLCL